MEVQEQDPPGSYTWVTAPRVQNGTDSRFAGMQMVPGFGPHTRMMPAARAKKRKGIFLPLHLCRGTHLAPRGPQQSPTNPVALGVAEPMQSPHPGHPQTHLWSLSTPTPPKAAGSGDAGAVLTSHSRDGSFIDVSMATSLFFFPLSFECSKPSINMH